VPKDILRYTIDGYGTEDLIATILNAHADLTYLAVRWISTSFRLKLSLLQRGTV
jgi:hypothetical protein